MEASTIPETYPGAAPTAARVLIADDQPQILEAIRLLLQGCGFSTEGVTQPAHVLRALAEHPFDIVLLDLNYSRDTTAGKEGLELVSQIRSIDKLLPVLAMTAWGSVDQAVEAMQRGAWDFVQKPWDNRQLLQKLQHLLSRAQARRRVQLLSNEELRAAREIQDKLLPKQLPELAGYEIAATRQPLRFVGGDYYNVVRLSAQHTMLCMADVAGKGLPAALLMSSLQAALQPLIIQRLSPAEVCQRLNRILWELMPADKFISCFYAVLDTREKRLAYCNAGHNPPLLIRRDAGLIELNAAGAVLGEFPDWRYEQSDVQIRSGDTLLVFTDGLVEAVNADEESFGEDSVVRIMRGNHSSSAHDLMSLLIRAALQHCGGRFQDDVTAILLKAT